MDNLLDTYLVGGKKLGDCTKADILAEIDRLKKEAALLGRSAAGLELVQRQRQA